MQGKRSKYKLIKKVPYRERDMWWKRECEKERERRECDDREGWREREWKRECVMIEIVLKKVWKREKERKTVWKGERGRHSDERERKRDCGRNKIN
jgi:hypothetical protein